MRWQDLITVDSEIMHGAPCFRGTRVPVSVVLDNLAAGTSEAELFENYPTLPREARAAALAYAADLTRDRVLHIRPEPESAAAGGGGGGGERSQPYAWHG